MKLPPRGKEIIECKNIDLVPKDIMVLENWADFIHLSGTNNIIFKLKKTYYCIFDTVVYIYTETD